jgi:hypothetical protein
MIIASITFVVGSLLLRESRNVKIWAEVVAHPKQNQPMRSSQNEE